MRIRRLFNRRRKAILAATNVPVQVGAAGVGGLIGGLRGIALAATVGEVAKEVLERWLSPKQRERIVELFNQIEARITALEDQGLTRRQNGFFDDHVDSRSDAREVAEAVLIAAATEHEERKLPFLASLFANIAFDPQVDRGMANYLVRLAESLSYRQLSLLALIGRKEKFPLPDECPAEHSWAAWAVWQELDELGFGSKEMVGVKSERPGLLPTNMGIPAALELMGGGLALYSLMDLNQIDDEDIRPIAASLWERLLTKDQNPSA